MIKIDKAPWYRWALKRMGLKYEHETFGERNAIEGWFNILKARLKRFWKRFPSNASKESVEKWLTAFVVIYNLEVRISWQSQFPRIKNLIKQLLILASNEKTKDEPTTHKNNKFPLQGS